MWPTVQSCCFCCGHVHIHTIYVALYYYSSKAWSTKGTAVQCGCIEAAARRRCARNNHQFDRRSFEKEKKRKTDINMSRCTYVYVRVGTYRSKAFVHKNSTRLWRSLFFFWVILYDDASRVSMYIVVGHEYMLESRQPGNLKPKNICQPMKNVTSLASTHPVVFFFYYSYYDMTKQVGSGWFTWQS